MSIRYPSDIIFHVYSFNLMLMKIYDIVWNVTHSGNSKRIWVLKLLPAYSVHVPGVPEIRLNRYSAIDSSFVVFAFFFL